MRETIPAEAPLDMPTQPISAARIRPSPERDAGWRLAVLLVLASISTTFAGVEMASVFAPSGISWLEWATLGLYLLCFAWISAACATVFAGAFILFATPPRTQRPAQGFRTASRTAIILPIYNESVAHVMGGAESMMAALRKADAEGFELFILSDSTKPEIAAAEAAAFEHLRRRVDAAMFYRHRAQNTGKKAGNVADFVRRWGSRYDYMVVLDADSIMSPEALVELVRRMDFNPRTALVQTLPVIVSAKTIFARAQQFAQRAYGAIFGAGLAWWSGGAGNFWGHNAIVRVAAFAAHAGLPHLPGRAPLGGAILSHDFVEAALLRRAGWRIEIAPDIDGSYEQCPPTLVDMAARDRRWAQGNLQHITILLARGFDWVSRAHITAGLMGYLSSAIWMALLFVGFVLAMQHEYAPGRGGSLVLLGVTTAILLSPKWLAILLWSRKRLPGWDRDPRFIGGVAVEAMLSTLIAPLLMVNQAAAVLQTLLGRDSGWGAQVRHRNGVGADELVRSFWGHVVFALMVVVASIIVSPMMALQTAPVTLTLGFAAPLAITLAQALPAGHWLAAFLATPEETKPPAAVEAAIAAASDFDWSEPAPWAVAAAQPRAVVVPLFPAADFPVADAAPPADIAPERGAT